MTVSTSSSQTTIAGNGVTTVFTFSFIAVSASNLSVIYTDAYGNQTVLGSSQYTVTLNAAATGQIWGVGGTVTYPTSGSAIATGTSITIQRILPFTQATSISNQGSFYPQAVEAALDTICMEIQQVASRTGLLRGNWATGVTYNPGDIVIDGSNGANTGSYYASGTQATSTTWAADLASGYWTLLVNVTPLATQVTNAATSATAAATSATAAATSAAAAASSAAAALAAPAINGVVIDSSDTTPGKLASKLLAGTGITSTIGNVGANETITLAVATGITTRNLIINGAMQVDQRNAGASQTITAGTSNLTNAYTVDRFYAACTGANVTGQRVSGSAPDQYLYQFTGAASVTGIAFGQRVEAANVYPFAGTTATLSVKLANSVLTTVTWSAYYPTATDNWAGRTLITSGTFTISSTLTRYSAQIAIPAAATAGLSIEFTVGAQTSGTWQIGEVQIEPGTALTTFERIPYSLTYAMCQWYFRKYLYSATAWIISATGVRFGYTFPPMRTAASFLTDYGSAVAYGPGGGQSLSSPSVNTITASSLDMTCTAASGGMTTNYPGVVNGTHGLSAEL